MNGNAAAVINAAKQGHNAGWEKARECMPTLEINELIQIISTVFEAKDHQADAALEAAKTLAENYKKPLDVYMNAFSVSFIENGLQQVSFQNIAELGTEQFANKIIRSVKNVEKVVEAYCHSEIDEVELISRLGKTGLLDVCQSFIQASGINLDEVKEQIQEALGDVNGASILLISFTASAAAYKMLKEALADAAAMRETRIRIEEECNTSIAMMKQYRDQMNSAVSDYLFIRTETFIAGMSAMDQAILDGDVDGFIRGNVMIQEILNYKVQFRNQDEFNSLMDSDAAFTL